MNLRRKLPHEITYWQKTSQDAFGKPVFAPPVVRQARWADRAELFLDTDGKQALSGSVIVLEESVAIGGYLAQGQSAEANALNVAGAREIRQTQATPNVRGTQTLYRAFL